MLLNSMLIKVKGYSLEEDMFVNYRHKTEGLMALKINRNGFTLGLMGSSIFLLMVLQVFWILREYQNAGQTFKKETNLVFQNTLHALMASNFQEIIRIDSTGQLHPSRDSRNYRKNGILSLYQHVLRGYPSSPEMPDTSSGRKHVRIFVSNVAGATNGSDAATMDSIHGRTPGRFFIRFDPDSLDTAQLNEKFRAELKAIDRDIKFKVVKKLIRGNDRGAGADTAKFVTDFVQVNPRYQYAAVFEDVDKMLVKEIIPQISFSVFLLVLTTGAFLILYKSLVRQQNLVHQKNDFISNVSHELKTPVATVSVALEALQNFHALENPQRKDEYLNLAQNALKQLSMLTEKVLDITVLGEKGTGVRFGQVDLRVLLEQVTGSMQLVLEKQKATVHARAYGHNFIVTGNKMHLSSILHNLLDNAVKFSMAPARVLVTLKEERHSIMLTVKDHGMGIPRVYQKSIFEKFFRVPQDNVHNVKGYGLGLSYTLQVVKAHKGRITVESEMGTGSSFCVILPKYGYGGN